MGNFRHSNEDFGIPVDHLCNSYIFLSKFLPHCIKQYKILLKIFFYDFTFFLLKTHIHVVMNTIWLFKLRFGLELQPFRRSSLQVQSFFFNLNLWFYVFFFNVITLTTSVQTHFLWPLHYFARFCKDKQNGGKIIVPTVQNWLFPSYGRFRVAIPIFSLFLKQLNKLCTDLWFQECKVAIKSTSHNWKG